MRTLCLHVQWDGTDFSGWQAQPDQRTVQGTLTEAVARMVHHPVQLFGSSRTDAGVHALSMPVAFDTPRTIPPKGFARGLNTHLPDDISILSADERPLGWRPRAFAVAKTYRYQLQLGPRRALSIRYAWWLKRLTLDLDAMRAASQHMLGEHDFSAFRSAMCTAHTTRRCIHAIHIQPGHTEDLITIEVIGNAFLRNMVRILVGTLVEVGTGRRPPHWVAEVIASADRTLAGPTAPGAGLTLAKVHFEGYPMLGKDLPTLEETPHVPTL